MPRRQQQQQQHQHESYPDEGGGFRGNKKPSDFYPEGVKRVPRPEQEGVQHPSHQHHQSESRQRPDLPGVADFAGGRKDVVEDPTSPLSPPPGPIPMGCSPSHLNVNKVVGRDQEQQEEPTSPMPAPPGAIPMPCSPDLLKQSEHEGGEPAGGHDVADNSGKDTEAAERAEQHQQEVHEIPVSSEGGEGSDHPQEQQGQAKRKPSREEVSLNKMQKVKDEVGKLVERINNFRGDKKDREYLYLDEMLTRHLLSLDGVDTCGKDEIRQMRKESIRTINRCLSMLDSKARGTEVKADGKDSTDASLNNTVLDQLAEQSKGKM